MHYTLGEHCLRWLTAIWGTLVIACMFLLTLGTDEAWVLNGLRSCLEPVVADLSSEVIETNGGLFAAANILLELLFGSQVWIHRLFSVACLLGLVLVTSHSTGFPTDSRTVQCITIAPL